MLNKVFQIQCHWVLWAAFMWVMQKGHAVHVQVATPNGRSDWDITQRFTSVGNIMLNPDRKKVIQGRQAGFLNKALKYMENCNVLWEQSCECRSCFVTGQLLWQSDSRARERHDDAFEKSAMQTRNFHHSGLGSRERQELRRGSGCCCYVRACVGHIW